MEKINHSKVTLLQKVRLCYAHHPTETSGLGRLLPDRPVQCLLLFGLFSSEVAPGYGQDDLKFFERLIQRHVLEQPKWFDILVVE